MIDQLFTFIRDARRRWRLRIALRGTAWLVVTLLAALVLASWWMDRLRFAPGAIIAASIVVWLLAAVVAWRALRPLRRRWSDADVALYLEEHEPGLGGAMLAAVEHARSEDAAVSRGLSMRLVDDAVQRARTARNWPTIERRGIAQASSVLAAAALVTVILGVTRPDFIANGTRALIPVVGLAARPYTIATSPGDTTIPRGADVTLTGTLRGFNSPTADLLIKREGSTDWEHLAMTQTGRGRDYAALLFNVRAPLTWAIEASGVRSPEHTVKVADLPWVDRIRTVLELPGYTRVAPRESESGDVAGLPGSRVTVRVRPTLPVASAALLMDDDTIALTAADDGTMTGSFLLHASGEYRILFPGLDGRLAVGSSAYVVEVLEDLPPTVRLTKPGRDADATQVDEVFLEAQADDDFGIANLELNYRVNGGEERTLSLYAGTPRTDVVAGHTVFLEEMQLQPGDVISYFARVRDARPGAPVVTSDIYFLTIRPFDRAFREAEQNGMPGQGGVDAGELSERQRQIVAGTFRVMQGKAGTSEAERRDNLATLALAQGRLREEVETLLRRLRTRGVAQQDPTMAPVAAALDTAVAAMGDAEQQLGRRAPDAALTPEQRALAMLQRAEAVFNRERQVSRGQQNGQGGGGGNSASAEELADLFTLELDRMRNQYETVQRDQQQQQGQQADSLLERLRELARRQQQENARRGQDERSTMAANQRRLAAEADSIARQLERLSRERDQQELADAARRMREAANQMRQGAADPSAGADALERMREAASALERGRTESSRRGVDDATERARRLQQQQREVAQGVNALPADPTQQRQGQVLRLVEQKNRMADEVNSLETELDRLSRESQRQGQAEAARRLREASRGLREGRVEDKIRFSRGVMQGRSPDYARSFEESIGADIDSLAQRLAGAAGSIGETREDRIARQLERARDVADAIETMSERSRQAQRAQQQGQQNQQQGQQPGQQQGQQGQQPGQQGQQQGQQSQQPGQQGQQGANAGRGGNTPRSGDRTADRAEAARQQDRELRERARELGEIRDALRREGVDVADLEALMGGFRADNNGPAGTPRGIEQLERTVVPGLREFEFDVRRSVFGSPRTPTLVGETRVPESFRTQVERYYRSLSERR